MLRDAQAILVYLASRYDPNGLWYPRSDPTLLGEIGQWLAFADGITATASAARLHDGLFYDLDVAAARAGAHRLFRILDEHLWFREQEGRRLDLRRRAIRPSQISRAFPTSCCPKKAASRGQDLPGHPPLVRPLQADQRFYRHAGHLPGQSRHGGTGTIRRGAPLPRLRRFADAHDPVRDAHLSWAVPPGNLSRLRAPPRRPAGAARRRRHRSPRPQSKSRLPARRTWSMRSKLPARSARSIVWCSNIRGWWSAPNAGRRAKAAAGVPAHDMRGRLVSGALSERPGAGPLGRNPRL